MAAGRPSIPKKIEKLLYQETGSLCPICSESNVNVLTIHHIIPFSKLGKHEEQAMIVLCANCHAKADNLEISADELFALKKTLPNQVKTKHPKVKKVKADRPIRSVFAAGRDINIDGPVVINQPRPSKRQSTNMIVKGTVREEALKYNYLTYLIDRYNELKLWHMKRQGKGNEMKYFLIRQSYQRQLKCKVGDTPIAWFEKGVNYLKQRIDKTFVGRIQKKKNKRLYRSFSEYVSLGNDKIELSDK